MNGTGLWELLLVLIPGAVSPTLIQVRRVESGRNVLNISIEISILCLSSDPLYPFSPITVGKVSKREHKPKKRPLGKALWINGWLMPQSMRISIFFLFLILHYFLILHNTDASLHKYLNFLNSCQILYTSNNFWEWISHICYNLPIHISCSLYVSIF